MGANLFAAALFFTAPVILLFFLGRWNCAAPPRQEWDLPTTSRSSHLPDARFKVRFFFLFVSFFFFAAFVVAIPSFLESPPYVEQAYPTRRPSLLLSCSCESRLMSTCAAWASSLSLHPTKLSKHPEVLCPIMRKSPDVCRAIPPRFDLCMAAILGICSFSFPLYFFSSVNLMRIDASLS